MGQINAENNDRGTGWQRFLISANAFLTTLDVGLIGLYYLFEGGVAGVPVPLLVGGVLGIINGIDLAIRMEGNSQPGPSDGVKSTGEVPRSAELPPEMDDFARPTGTPSHRPSRGGRRKSR